MKRFIFIKEDFSIKKILVILLIFVAAGGMFAQEGTWSISGNAEVGGRFDFDPDDPANPDADKAVAVLAGTAYRRPYSMSDEIYARLALGYTRGSIATSLEYSNRRDRNQLNAVITGNGDKYTFASQTDLGHFFRGTDTTTNPGTSIPIGGSMDLRFKRLWASYKMIDSMVTLEGAFTSADKSFWVSDVTGAYIEDVVWTGTARNENGGYNENNAGKIPVQGTIKNNYSRHLWEPPKTFTKVDGHNYLTGNLSIGGLDIGLLLPNVFATAYNRTQPVREGRTPSLMDMNDPNENGTTEVREGGHIPGQVQVVEHILKRTVLGFKYSMETVEFAGQVLMENYGVYFGGKFNAGPVVAGFSFMGMFGDSFHYRPSGVNTEADRRTMKIGASLDYNPGSFGAGLKGWYRVDGDPNAAINVDYIGIEPSLFYNAIPTHLRFQLDAGFYFENAKFLDGTKENDVYWALQPQLFYNFRGTGAGSYSAVGTGMIFRYRMFSDSVNALDIVFKANI